MRIEAAQLLASARPPAADARRALAADLAAVLAADDDPRVRGASLDALAALQCQGGILPDPADLAAVAGRLGDEDRDVLRDWVASLEE